MDFSITYLEGLCSQLLGSFTLTKLSGLSLCSAWDTVFTFGYPRMNVSSTQLRSAVWQAFFCSNLYIIGCTEHRAAVWKLCVCVCVCMCVCVCVSMCMCVSVCMGRCVCVAIATVKCLLPNFLNYYYYHLWACLE